MKEKNINGVTLVALVITIIILLILAGISIQTITNTSLFDKAKQAKNVTENAQKEENKTLSEYIDKMNEYLPETLVYKVNNGEIQIGEYIKYIPDKVSDDEEKYKTLISNLEKYSGSNDNTTNTLKQEMDLKWRVLDVKDGQVRLISETPTRATISLGDYNGYNNIVKLLDDTCSTLYSNINLTSKVQNIKIEDITKYMLTPPIIEDTKNTPENIDYPNILKQEKNQTINESVEENKKIGLSEQIKFELGKSTSSKSSLQTTSWYQKTDETSFKNQIYYELFIGKDGNNYHPKYWMSSRCIGAYSDIVGFHARMVEAGGIGAHDLYNSRNVANIYSCAFRPVITLNSNVQVEETKSVNGTEISTIYEIK